ncbi:MAG: hypothetical protein JXA90_06350 [Planctomycetes bacterium]|nr:hypothetical protein [Planctomycetota bacterium]
MGDGIPEGFGRGEWVGQTTIDPVGLAAILSLAAAMLVVKRHWALLPVMLCACFIPVAQRVVLFGLDFDFLRIMVLAGWARVIGRKEYRGFTWKPPDTAIVLWALSATVIYTLLYGTSSAFIYKLGQSFTALGSYFLFRTLAREWRDVDRIVTIFALVSIPVAIAFILESQTGRNAFAFLGGVPELTPIRQGRLRCQGAFAHPILAGCFWACALPLLVCSLPNPRQRKPLLAAGILCSGLIVIASASSTPVSAVIFAIAGICMFPLRGRMRAIRWGALVGVILLHMVMKAPVWHLISRVDFAGGSTGWHRYILIDGAIRHFHEWWLIGTRSTYHWASFGMFDITNQYIFEGINGGLLTLVLFLLLIARTFAGGGRIWRGARGEFHRAFLAWGLGVALFVHCANFIAVTYFGQIIVLWFMNLAVIVSLEPVRAHVSRTAGPAPASEPGEAPRAPEVAPNVPVRRRRPAPAMDVHPTLYAT